MVNKDFRYSKMCMHVALPS